MAFLNSLKPEPPHLNVGFLARELECSYYQLMSNIFCEEYDTRRSLVCRKLVVDHFRVFGCITYVHVPDPKRKKLDNKREKCVLLETFDFHTS